MVLGIGEIRFLGGIGFIGGIGFLYRLKILNVNSNQSDEYTQRGFFV
jgi:hypothetical protein